VDVRPRYGRAAALIRARAIGAALIAAVAAALWLAGPAAAQEPIPPIVYPERPAQFEIDGRAAARVAAGTAEVRGELAARGPLETRVEARPEDDRWQVGYFDGDEEVAVVFVDPASGAVREAWTGEQVAWPMARGYEGQFGHVLNAPYVWIPLCLIFLAGLIDWRRPWRVAHLDLLALLAFGVSHVFFNQGEIGVSVPLVYPPLVYLLARMLWIGFRGGEPLRPRLPVVWLGLATVVLIVFRITLNVADSGVIDVGYAGVVGADRVSNGEVLYGEGVFPEDNGFGDTYGPFNYYAYVPFELIAPWSGEWDELPAAHAAAIAFDVATIAGLFVLGARLRRGRAGRELGVVLAFAWVAYPYTAFALQSNSNDSLVAALVVWSLALFAKPAARGTLLALAVAAKFAPLVLAPLYVAGDRGLLARGERTRPRAWPGRLRAPAIAGAAFAAVVALMLAHPAIDPGLATFWERTVASQLDRSSPFSLWGQIEGIDWLQKGMLAFSAVLAVALAFVPRRRTPAQVAALAAALLLALQLSVDHWFYLYIPWFAGPVLIALASCAPRRSADRPAVSASP